VLPSGRRIGWQIRWIVRRPSLLAGSSGLYGGFPTLIIVSIQLMAVWRLIEYGSDVAARRYCVSSSKYTGASPGRSLTRNRCEAFGCELKPYLRKWALEMNQSTTSCMSLKLKNWGVLVSKLSLSASKIIYVICDQFKLN
jgi:hypothetical protein